MDYLEVNPVGFGDSYPYTSVIFIIKVPVTEIRGLFEPSLLQHFFNLLPVMVNCHCYVSSRSVQKNVLAIIQNIMKNLLNSHYKFFIL